jgi:hypothetical protein
MTDEDEIKGHPIYRRNETENFNSLSLSLSYSSPFLSNKLGGKKEHLSPKGKPSLLWNSKRRAKLNTKKS